MPAARAGLMPRPMAMPIRATPTVPEAVQDEPVARPTMAVRSAPTTKNAPGEMISRP